MSAQSMTDATSQSFDSMRDQGCQLWPAQITAFDDSSAAGSHAFTGAKASVHERSPGGYSKTKVGRWNKAVAVPPGLQQPGYSAIAGASPQLPSLLGRIPRNNDMAGPRQIPEKASKLAPEQQAGDRVQMVAKAVEEAMLAGLLPAALGESHDGETLTTRILNNFQATNKSQAGDGVNSPGKHNTAEVPTPTGSTCTIGSPMKRSSSTDLDSASSTAGEAISRPCEASSQDEGAAEPNLESVGPSPKSKGTKAAAQGKMNRPNLPRNLPSWLSNVPPQTDATVGSPVAKVQSAVESPTRSFLSRDKLRARGRESLEAMEGGEGGQPMNLTMLRARGHNVLAGVNQHQQHQQHRQPQQLPQQPGVVPGLLPPFDDVSPPLSYVTSSAYNAAPMPYQMLGSGLPIMPPPGLPLAPPNYGQHLPVPQAGDATCACLLSSSQAKTYQARIEEKGSTDVHQRSESLRVELPSGLKSKPPGLEEDLASQEDTFIDNVCNHFDASLPMTGSMGTSCTVEFGDEPLKIDFTCLQSINVRG